MAAAETTDTINCSFKLREFWVPAAISALCGVAAVALGFYFLLSGGFRLDAWVYSAVNLLCSVPFFMIAMGYFHLLSGDYRMEIGSEHIVWPLPSVDSLYPISRRHVRVPNTDVVSVSIVGNPDGGRGLVLLVRRNGQRFLMGLPSLARTPAQLAELFQRHGYRTSLKITEEAARPAEAR